MFDKHSPLSYLFCLIPHLIPLEFDPMKNALLILLLTVTATTARAGDSSAGRAIPDVIPAPIEGAPTTWVAVDVAIDANGELTDKVPTGTDFVLRNFDEARKAEAARKGVNAQAGASPDCDGMSMSLPEVEHYHPNRTFEDLTGEAADVVFGKVVATRQGFFRGTLAMMVRFEVTGWLRRSQALNTIAGDQFLVYPWATLRAHGSVYCTRPTGFRFEPRVGDRVLVFSYSEGIGPDRSLIHAEASREVIFERDAKIMLPPDLRSDPVFANVRTLDELLARVAMAVSQRNRRIPKQRGDR